MFTIDKIDHVHARLGSAKTLPEYVRALKAVGVERYDSYLTDGHSEYFGAAPDDVLRDVDGPCAERDREVDCGHR